MKTHLRTQRIREADLPSHLKLVLYDLAGRANSRDECWPAQTSIARDTGLGLRTVSRSLKDLRAIGVLLAVPRRPGGPLLYRLQLRYLAKRVRLGGVGGTPGGRTKSTMKGKTARKPRKPTHIAGILACRACGARPSADGEGGKCLDCRREDRRNDRATLSNPIP